MCTVTLPKRVVVCGFLCWSIALPSAHCLAESNGDILDFLPAILAGTRTSEKKLPKPIVFTVELPNLGVIKEYTIELNRWNIPNIGTQAETTTDNLQAAIDWAVSEGFNRIIIPEGTYLIGKYGNDIYQQGIELESNMELVLTPETIIQMAPNDKWNYCVIAVNRQTNVVIRGGTIIGDRDQHIYTPRPSDGSTGHDEGHGICVQYNTTKVLVEDMVIRDVTGDGLLLVSEIEDVTIRNNNIFNNRRQGVSLVGSSRIKIENNEIHHIKGASPSFGVDIEGAGRVDRDIIVRGNSFHHNRGGDVVNTSGSNVFIIDNVMSQGTPGFDNRYIDGPLVTWERTDNVIAHNTITMYDRSVNGLLGIIQYSSDRDENPEMTYIHDNVCNGCGMYMYKANNADIRRNSFLGYFLALSDFTNATVVDNVVTRGPAGTPQYCWTYRIRNTTGFASGNTWDGRPANLGLSDEPWTSECLR